MTRLQEMLKEIAANGYIDEHDNKIKLATEFDLVVELNKGAICSATTHHRYCSLNELYFDTLGDCNLYLSRMSVGGVLWQDDFQRYNDSCTFEGGKIREAYKFNGIEFELVFSL